MMTFSKKWALALLGTSALAVMPYADAEARAPVQSRSVQKTTPSALTDADIDGASIVAGIAACRKGIDADARVKFSFETNLATTDPLQGDASQQFQGPFAYELQRNGTTRVKCLDDDAECQDLGAEALEVGDGVVEVEVALRDLLGFSNPELCDTEATDMQHFVQIYVEPNFDISTTPADYSEGRVVMDLIRPDAPIAEEGLSTASKMQLTMEPSEAEDVKSYFAVVRTEAFEGEQLHGELDGSVALLPVDFNATTGVGEVPVNLAEGSVAYVAVVAQDEALNYSVLSGMIEVDVIETDDFWDFYTEAGGSETGGYGCASTGGSTTSLFALLMTALVLGFGRLRRIRSTGTRH